jgi:hypothetical protein
MALVAWIIPACVRINGGAVEISWLVVQEGTGGVISDCGCADPPIAKVRLKLTGKGGSIEGATPCAGQAQCDFPCQNQTGATAFDIPPTGTGESYAAKLVAVGTDGSELADIMTPDDVFLQVVQGQPTEGGAFALTASCALRCSGNVCAPQ